MEAGITTTTSTTKRNVLQKGIVKSTPRCWLQFEEKNNYLIKLMMVSCKKEGWRSVYTKIGNLTELRADSEYAINFLNPDLTFFLRQIFFSDQKDNHQLSSPQFLLHHPLAPGLPWMVWNWNNYQKNWLSRYSLAHHSCITIATSPISLVHEPWYASSMPEIFNKRKKTNKSSIS